MQETVPNDQRSMVGCFTRLEAGDLEPELAVPLTALIEATSSVFAFPDRAVLLWSGCLRSNDRYTFPEGLKDKWRIHRGRGMGQPDSRMRNGPPNSAFKLAGGKKLPGWELDHIYDGNEFWSVRQGQHFTQSAGLVAMPRHVHLRRHSDDSLTWLLRGIAYLRFGYDPLEVFSMKKHDKLGFVVGRTCEVFWPEPMNAIGR